MNQLNCPRERRVVARVLALVIAAASVLAMIGCSNPAKAKAEHLNRGEAYLKDKKYQEASLEFRNAIQLDDNLAAAHWGLAQSYEGLQRFGEMIDELKRTTALDANNLDARVKLGNYYVLGSQKYPELIAEAERLDNEVLQKDPNHIEGHILKASILFAQGKPVLSLAELKRAIELDPKHLESYLSLARFYMKTNDANKAEEAFKQAIAVDDKSAQAHTEYGKFLVQTNRAPLAEAEFRRAVEVDPANRDSRLVLASFYLVNKQNDKAEQEYKALAELDRDKPEGRSVLANFYASVGRLDEAVNIYREIVAKSPDYAAGRYRLGELLLQRGDTKGAAEQAGEVLKKNDRDLQALLLRARINSQSTEPDANKKAIEDLKEVLKQEPTSKPGLYFMADAMFRDGQLDQARTFANELERNYPEYLPAKLLQVQLNQAAGDQQRALRLANDLVDRAAKATPDSETSPQLLAEVRAKSLIARGTINLQLRNTAAARQDFSAVRDAMPNAPASYVNLAAVSLAENKADEATGLYDRALSLDNVNADALNGLINLYARQNRFDQAHARIDQAISGQPNNAQLHFLKAQIYGFQHNAQGAETELRRTLELDDKYLPAYSSLAALFINTNQQEQAIAQYRKILEKKPDSAATYTLIGMLEDSRQNHDAAIENYRKALELDQNSTFAANNLAWNYAAYDKGNLDEAVRLAQGNVQKFPDVPGFADTLGWVYYKKGLHAAAVEQLQKAVNLDTVGAQKNKQTPSPAYRYHLGMALAGKGDKTGARREIGQALNLGKDKNFAEADDARRALTTL
ncbi:MAG: tetratricopeptide repeat protein [Pyrinomonadaceae bacterium]